MKPVRTTTCRARASWAIALVLPLALTLTTSRAQARCGDGPTDAEEVAATRAEIAAECSCATAVKHSDYTRCARGVASSAVAAGALSPSCQSSIMRCANRSTCGRPDAVTCCVTNRSGKTTCSVKRSAAQCRAPAGGHACAGSFSSCCDACGPSGCLAPPTPTPGPTPTPVHTATPAPTGTPPDFCQATVGLPAIARVPFTLTQGTTSCGGPAFSPPAAPPLTGEVDDGSGGKLADLGLGCLYASTLPSLPLLPGGTAVVNVVGLGVGTVVLGGSAGDGPLNCTKGAGPGRHCLNGRSGTDGQGTCGADADCGGDAGSCALDGNCFFGPPVPVPNGFLSACAVNAFLSDLCGDVNLLNQQVTFATTVQARVYLTQNPDSPCPTCDAGVCTGGKNAGKACTAIGPANTSNDCPPSPGSFLGALTIPFPDLTTGTSTLTADANGDFCAGQSAPGAFGLPSARTIVERGQGPGGGGNLLSMQLASTFCLQKAGGLIDGVANLPGPGAVSAAGTLDLSGLLPLP